MESPRIVLGTMTIGAQTNEADAATMISDFCGPKWAGRQLVRDNPMIDTAIMYVNGKTEQVLGRILNNGSYTDTISLATKANPFAKDKNLSPSGVRSQLEASLASLRRDDGVDIFYLHAPDVNHPIEPTLEEVQKIHDEGKFRRFALSNFTAWETVYIHSYMSQRGYVAPTIYQGMYNAITRQVESELLPALRKLGMSFYAYNPLGGGMLTGKYAPQESDEASAKANADVGGRFAGKTIWAKRYRERFQRREQFEALEVVRAALVDGDGMADVSLRWLMHHSKLGPGDGIIVGASTLAHYHANMQSLHSGPLPDYVVKAFETANGMCQEVCPDYARGYSGSACSAE